MSSYRRTQARTAARYGAVPVLVGVEEKVGISENVKTGLQPLNALRQLPVGDTSGWYIWAGGELTDDPLFFAPLHVQHLSDWCPELLPYLGLPPGWRVLLAPGYEDVWYDDTLRGSDDFMSVA